MAKIGLGLARSPLKALRDMNSYDHPSFYHRQPHYPSYYQQPPRPYIQETTLKSEYIQIERKSFMLALKENPRGRFLRISEDVNGKRNAIIVPAAGLAELKKLVDEMVEAALGMEAGVEPAKAPEVVPAVASVAPAAAPSQTPVAPIASIAPVAPVPTVTKPAKRTMSEATRAKISAAAKARWAKVNAAKPE
ncbi:MAG TPA: PUR family DNA/RNA-binding protein [Verrucomicrobiae bacterium]